MHDSCPVSLMLGHLDTYYRADSEAHSTEKGVQGCASHLGTSLACALPAPGTAASVVGFCFFSSFPQRCFDLL